MIDGRVYYLDPDSGNEITPSYMKKFLPSFENPIYLMIKLDFHNYYILGGD